MLVASPKSLGGVFKFRTEPRKSSLGQMRGAREPRTGGTGRPSNDGRLAQNEFSGRREEFEDTPQGRFGLRLAFAASESFEMKPPKRGIPSRVAPP